jgi:uncharacterized protein YkwD
VNQVLESYTPPPPPSSSPPRKHKFPVAATVGSIVIILIVSSFVALGYFPAVLNSFLTTKGGLSSTFISSKNPSIGSNGVTISYPSDYATLENYALGLINADRRSANLSSVVLSPIPSGQQHADSMLYYGYFSHWDTQGFKPYMRYSLLNGTGFVDENVAFEEVASSSSLIQGFTSTSSVEGAIQQLEYQMMYNDSSCCQNGHRDNILSPYHNRVSIGIEYDRTHVYFVEDFENYYTELSQPYLYSNGNLVLKGNTTGLLSPTTVLVFYDKTPKPLNATILDSEYDKPYTQGNFTGGVFPSCTALNCEAFPQGDCPSGCVTVYASTWKVTNGAIDIEFPLDQFVSTYGSGVYTFYVEQGSQDSPEYLTSISVFVTA